MSGLEKEQLNQNRRQSAAHDYRKPGHGDKKLVGIKRSNKEFKSGKTIVNFHGRESTGSFDDDDKLKLNYRQSSGSDSILKRTKFKKAGTENLPEAANNSETVKNSRMARI